MCKFYPCMELLSDWSNINYLHLRNDDEVVIAKLIHLLVNLNCIIKPNSKRDKINYKMKKIFMPTIFIVLYLSIITQGIAIMSSIMPNDRHQINNSGESLMPVTYAAGVIQRTSSGERVLTLVVPVAQKSNITISEKMDGNITI